MSLEVNPNIAAAPIYIGGTSIESVRKQYDLEEVIKLASNESMLGLSPLVIETIQQAASSLNRYPPMGDETLRTLLAETIGRELEPDNFFTGNGGCDVLSMIAASFLRPGDEAIICRPTFPVYEITARRAGGTIIYADLDSEQFTYDIEAILAAVTPQTRLLYICSPNNPTGNTITAVQLETLVKHLPDHVLLIADEVYHHFATKPDRPDTLAYLSSAKNIIIIHSFSKAFGLAGLRLGYAIAPVEIARYLSRARESFHLSKLTQEAGKTALQDKAHLEKTISLTISGRKWLHEQLGGLDLAVWPSQANFILFKPPVSPTKLSDRLLRQGIIVRPLAQFYLPTHLRVTVGLPEENEQFISTLARTLAEMKVERLASEETASQTSREEFKF
jgi:histidinol-phosphate aminotransferase